MAHRFAFISALGGLGCITIDALEPKLLGDAAASADHVLELLMGEGLEPGHLELDADRRHGRAVRPESQARGRRY
jgi:hypothetical protein